MNLSPNFTLDDLIKSETASRLNIDNTPDEEVIRNLTALAVNVLEPITKALGRPHINSAYRGPVLNAAIGGVKTSQHCEGKAADIEIPGMANADLANWVIANINFDQVILEFYTPDQPNSGWVHASYNGKANRKNPLTAMKVNGKTVYKAGILK